MKNRRAWAVIIACAVVGSFYGISEYRVSEATKPEMVYVAKQDIPPHTQITDDMLVAHPLSSKDIPGNVFKNKQDIVGKWTQVNYGFTRNSFFFKDKVVPQSELIDSARMKLKPGQRIYTLQTNILKSAAGNIVPGSTVDAWWLEKLRPDPQTGVSRIISGRLYQGLYVLSVKNSKAEDILQKDYTEPAPPDKNSTNQQPTTVQKELFPTVVELAVDDTQYQILASADALGQLSLTPQDGQLLKDPLQVKNSNLSNDVMDVKAIVAAQMANIPGEARKGMTN